MKVGTAHVEIKPVINEDALREIGERIESEVAAAVERGLNTSHIAVRAVQGEVIVPAFDAKLGRRIEAEAAAWGRSAGERFAEVFDETPGTSGPVVAPHD